jgi:DNA invertase Pin-like site-specific DNA recombinase
MMIYKDFLCTLFFPYITSEMSIAAQLKTLRKYCLARGWEIYKEFVDEAESARSANRPGFKDMIALAKQRHKVFDTILVWKLSRFARNSVEALNCARLDLLSSLGWGN